MLIKNILTLLFISISLFGYSQLSNIIGTVVDYDSQEPIANAIVEIEGFETVKSNSLGNFQLWNIPPGKYLLKVSAENHPTYSKKIVVKASNNENMHIEMGAPRNKSSKNSKEKKDTDSEDDKEEETKIEPTILDTPSLIIPTFDLDELDNAEDESNSDANISSVLYASRDPFYNTAAFTFGTYRFRLRGLDNANSKLYMNNIEMNDQGIGRPSWTQWGGLNDVLRNRTDAYGLDKNNFTFGGISGNTNIDLRASSQRKQLKVSYAFSNRSYMQRLMATYSSGLMKGGWAVSVSGSWRFANNDNISEKIRFNQEGTTYDAFSLFAGVDKKFGANHLLSLSVFAARNKRGKNGPATQEIMDLAGSNYYNPYWGYQTEANGKVYKRNSRVGNVFIPTAILMHDWKIKENSSLKTSFGFRKGINGSSALDWRDANDPRPDYYRNMPSFAGLVSSEEVATQVADYLRNNESARQVNWDQMYETNRANQEIVNNPNGTNDTTEYNLAQYIVAERRYDPTIINLSSVYENTISEKAKFTLGGNYVNQQTHNYQIVKDLLGAEKYIDINKFAARDFPNNDSLAQNDLNRFNRILDEGDKFGYDYTNHIRKAELWTQTELSFKTFDFFIANNISFTSFWREGHVKNGFFPDNSEGDSEIKNFVNFGLKGGATYKINGRNYIFANGSYATRAPYIRNSMLSPRTRNDFVPNLKSENIYSVEGGYLLKAPKIKARAVAYAAFIENQTRNRGVYFDQARTFGTYVINDINTRHWGFEAAVEIEAYTGFKITPVIAWGDHTYTDRPTATLIQDNSNEPIFEDKTLYYKGLHVASGPQAAYSLGFGYRTSSYWFFDLRFSYFDKIYIEVSPTRRTIDALDNVEKDSELWISLLSQERVSGQFVMDASVGKSIRLKDKNDKSHFINFNLNVNNITHNTKFRTGGFEQYRFSKEDGNLDRFQNKYFYAYGLNFFASVSYRF